MSIRSMFYVSQEVHDTVNALCEVRGVSKGKLLEVLLEQELAGSKVDHEKVKKILEIEAQKAAVSR